MLDTVEPLLYRRGARPNERKRRALPRRQAALPGNTLYLRLPSDSAIGMVQPILQRFRVGSPLCSTSKARAQSCAPCRISFVSPTQELVDTLSDMLGAKNVVLK